MSSVSMTEPEFPSEEADRAKARAEAKAAAIARGRAAVAEGRVVPHEEVRAWLLSLGTDKPLPRPKPKCG